MKKQDLIMESEDDFDIDNIQTNLDYLSDLYDNIYYFDFYKRKIRVRLIAS